MAKEQQSTEKAKAAKAEAENKPPVAEFRGLKLKLPESLPGSLAFDLFGLGASSDPTAQLRFLNTVLGMDQLEQLRAKMDDDGVTYEQVNEFFGELVSTILGAYGTTEGESPASDDS